MNLIEVCPLLNLRQGDTWSWTVTLTDYPASTYTLKFAAKTFGQLAISWTSTASGLNHVISVSSATTAAFNPGDYDLVVYAIKGAERTTIATGGITITPDFLTAQDTRSWAKRCYDAINATIEGRATSDELEYTIGGTTIKKMAVTDLLKMRTYFKNIIRKEEGKLPINSILVNFVR